MKVLGAGSASWALLYSNRSMNNPIVHQGVTFEYIKSLSKTYSLPVLQTIQQSCQLHKDQTLLSIEVLEGGSQIENMLRPKASFNSSINCSTCAASTSSSYVTACNL